MYCKYFVQGQGQLQGQARAQAQAQARVKVRATDVAREQICSGRKGAGSVRRWRWWCPFVDDVDTRGQYPLL